MNRDFVCSFKGKLKNSSTSIFLTLEKMIFAIISYYLNTRMPCTVTCKIFKNGKNFIS